MIYDIRSTFFRRFLKAPDDIMIERYSSALAFLVLELVQHCVYFNNGTPQPICNSACGIGRLIALILKFLCPRSPIEIDDWFYTRFGFVVARMFPIEHCSLLAVQNIWDIATSSMGLSEMENEYFRYLFSFYDIVKDLKQLEKKATYFPLIHKNL